MNNRDFLSIPVSFLPRSASALFGYVILNHGRTGVTGSGFYPGLGLRAAAKIPLDSNRTFG